MTWSKSQFRGAGDFDLAPGSVFGARWWRLSPVTGLLEGVMGGAWTPGVNEAACKKDHPGTTGAFRRWAAGAGPAVWSDDMEAGEEPPAHRPPVPECRCGFWAFWQPEATSPVPGGDPWLPGSRVLGVIEGYGRTVISERGFRCEKARIVALHVAAVFTDLARAAAVEEALGEIYGVPVYATTTLMLARHPLTTDYRPTPEPVSELSRAASEMGRQMRAAGASFAAIAQPLAPIMAMNDHVSRLRKIFGISVYAATQHHVLPPEDARNRNTSPAAVVTKLRRPYW